MRKPPVAIAVALAVGLAGCNADLSGSSKDESSADDSAQAQGTVSAGNEADEMASHDPAAGQRADVAVADAQSRPVMQNQVVLDRLGFMPGVVDGKMGASTRNAIEGFQQANALEVTGLLDDTTQAKLGAWNNIPATRIVTIPAAFAQADFSRIPDDPAQQAKMKQLGYASLDEKLAERFHTTIDVLKDLNPGGNPASKDNPGVQSADDLAVTSSSAPTSSATGDGQELASTQSFFHAGQKIRVPNVGADKIVPGSVDDADWQSTLRSLGVGSQQPQVTKIVVSKSAGTLKGYDASGKLVLMSTATMGSEHDPLPLGGWKILGIAHNPPFSYNPDLFWDVPDSTEKHMLPPGPNGPVGVVWIDLSKEHYGIHGTPNPETIGRVQSHGCIRLTNWDAARLAQMVSPGTKAIFES